MSIQEFKNKYAHLLFSSDLDLLLEFVLNKSKEYIFTHPELPLSSWQNMRLEYYAQQLLKKKPIHYIIGEKDFYGLTFKVNKYTLIPRPETEQLVDLAKKIILSPQSQDKKFLIIDIGTGSGNIIISLAKSLLSKTSYQQYEKNQQLVFFASDISDQALNIAKKNAIRHQCPIQFFRGDLLEPFLKIIHNSPREVIIMANLPYLSKEIYKQTAKKIKNYEPITALKSGEDGLDHYRQLLKQIKVLLKKSRKNHIEKMLYLLLEISPEQKDTIQKEIENVLPKAKIKIFKDLAGKWRIVKAELSLS